MQIRTNIESLSAQRYANRSAQSLQTSMQRLSSGLRVNSARDDAAGLSIAERMTSQLRGLSMASRNANDAVSMLQTAEGALATLTEGLQRIRELALQSANATNSLSDRRALQAEVDQQLAEIDRITSQTSFNGRKLFGDAGSNLETDANKVAVIDGLRDRWLQNSEARIAEFYGLEGDGAELKIIIDDTPLPNVAAFVSGNVDGATGRIVNQELHIDLADFVPPNPPDGGTAPFFSDRIIAHEMVHAVMGRTTSLAALPTWFAEGTAEFIHGADERVAADLAAAGGGVAGADAIVAEIGGAFTGTSAQYSSGYIAVRYLHQSIKDQGGAGIRDVMDFLSANTGATLDDALANVASSGSFATEAAFLADFTGAGGNGSLFLQDLDSNGLLGNTDTGAVGGADADGGATLTAKTVIADLSGYTTDPLSGFAEVWPDGHDVTFSTDPTDVLTFQVGAERGQTLDVQNVQASLARLGLEGLDVVDAPRKAISRIDDALDYINRARAEHGAALSRLDSVISGNTINAENTAAARSRIMDADFAAETATLVQNDLLRQAAIAMVAQANAAPQLALQLLS